MQYGKNMVNCVHPSTHIQHKSKQSGKLTQLCTADRKINLNNIEGAEAQHTGRRQKQNINACQLNTNNNGKQNTEPTAISDIIAFRNLTHNSPVTLVTKPNRRHQWLVCDYRNLNKQTIKTNFPMPTIQQLLPHLYGAKHFSTIDLKSLYYTTLQESESIGSIQHLLSATNTSMYLTARPWGYGTPESVVFS